MIHNKNSPVYTRGQFIDFCKGVFGYYDPGSGDNIQVVCPVCKSLKGEHYSKKKLAISLSKGKQGLLNCWVCGYKSRNLYHLIRKYFPQWLKEYTENYLNSEAINNLEKDKLPEVATLPKNFMLLATADRRDVYNRRALNYLKDRGADSEANMWYWKFGVSRAENVYNRIIVPSYNKIGVLNYYSARAMEKKLKPKYWNPEVERESIIFNEININWQEELTIVEGVFDLVKSNDNATCLLGSDLSSNYKLFEEIIKNKTSVVLALDPGAKNKQIMIAKRLFEFDVPVKVLTLKSGKDVGSLEKNEFIDLLKNAKLFNMDYFLKLKIASII